MRFYERQISGLWLKNRVLRLLKPQIRVRQKKHERNLGQGDHFDMYDLREYKQKNCSKFEEKYLR